MSALVEGIITQVGPALLQFAFNAIEDRLGEVKGGPMRAVAPVISEMMEHAQREVLLKGIGGVMDEHGRLQPSFRAPYEARILQALRDFGFAEGA
jgi:hypothetical protein